MKERYHTIGEALDGDDLLLRLQALANPHRLRILASLHRQGRNYVSRMAREAGISRPLMHLHLQRLERAGLVRSELELSPDGKALNFYEVAPFALTLTQDVIAKAASTLSDSKDKES
jgi:predicted transcriptional regulator